MANIKNIVFDFGGVLMDWDPKYLYRKIFDSEEKIDEFLTDVCHYEWNLMQDAGRPFKEAIAERVALFPQFEEEINLYFDRLIEMIVGIIDENVNLFNQLKKHFPIYGLTNWSSETFPLVYDDERYPFFKEMKGIVVSGIEKTRKPSDKIYHILLERYKLNANECVFIDDSLPNINTAEKLGFYAIHYQAGVTNVKNELLKLGVDLVAT